MPINPKDLVVGDVVRIENGGRVPADCRVLESSELQVDKSALNGESDPFRVDNVMSEPGTEPLEAHCLAFNGAPVVSGSALGLVIRTGDRTFIGNVARLSNKARVGESTFEHEVKAFVKIITILAISMGAIFYLVGVAVRGFKGMAFIDILINGFVIIVVANVPQGIPATVTSLLTVAAR